MKGRIKEKLNKIFTGREGFWPVFLVTVFFACLPLFTVNCINGHDVIYHLLRIEALKTGISEDLPFLRINMLFLGGEGYASSLFYPDTLLYIPALLRLAGISINSSYHLFVALTLILGFVTSYFSMKYISKDRYASMITAVIFTLAQYHLGDVYTRSAVGEFTALIFIPLVIAGLWDFAYEGMTRPWLLTIGMTGVILCHTLSTLFCLGLCSFFLIISIRKIIDRPILLLKLALTGLTALALTAFYWISMLEQMGSASFKYTKVSFDLDYEKLLLTEVFKNSYSSMGIAIFLPLLFAFFIRHNDRQIRFADINLFLGLIFTLSATGFFPWKRFAGRLSFIQFPWRLFIIAFPLLAFSAGLYAKEFVSENGKGSSLIKKSGLIAVLALMTVSAVSNYSVNDEGYYSYSDDYFDHAPYTAEIIGGEWLPTTVDNRLKLVYDADMAYTVDGEGIEVERDRNSLSVDLSGIEGDYIDVPFVYYKGYAAEDENAVPLKVDGNGENGRVRVYTDGAARIRVFYKGTLLQNTADIISLLSWIIIAVIAYRRIRKGKTGIRR